ncbi:hypothetical protein Cantr_09109 [Candida viswanathii]|uniref:Uncharacterized protein n=1 Tax=Candida viswanathii TaxID=5486 RepID=A0A367Y930_9ASCO|nr:hypothetical protein Cantr_09109 [Candida viswanathii]
MTFTHIPHTDTTIPKSPIAALSDEFSSILASSDSFDFTSYVYSFIANYDYDLPIGAGATAVAPTTYRDAKCSPSPIDAIAHLELLKAIAVMKKKALASCPNIDSGKAWKTFVNNAVRRFIVFISALKKSIPVQRTNSTNEATLFAAGIDKNQGFISMMDELMPPLDVVMVWHAFVSCNTKEAYDALVRARLLQFANYPLPLHNIVKFIDDKTFEFKVTKDFKKNYLDLVRKFTTQPFALAYEINEIKLYPMTVDIYCPNCNDKLAESVPFSNGESTGFVDVNFHTTNLNFFAKVSECHCTCFEVITHDELRKLQLFADVKRTGLLHGLFKHFSQVISKPEQANRNPTSLSIELALMLESSWESYHFENFRGMIKSLRAQLGNPDAAKLLTEYMLFNPIGMTIANGVELGFDLAQSVFKQERFIVRMNNMNWLQSPYVKQFLTESCSRYANFFTLLTDPSLQDKTLIPTLDIELVWQTHKLVLQGYISDCMHSSCHYLIDESKHEGKLDDSFKVTIDLYQQRFRESYNICYCQHCISLKCQVPEVFVSDSPFEVKSLFGNHPASYFSTTPASSSSGVSSPKRRKLHDSSSSLFLDSMKMTTTNTSLSLFTPMSPIDEVLEDLFSSCADVNFAVGDGCCGSPSVASNFGTPAFPSYSIPSSSNVSRTVSNSDMTIVDSLFSLTRLSTSSSTNAQF